MGIKSIKWIKRLIQEKIDEQQFTKPISVLDIGCGKGEFTKQIANMINTTVFGVDIDHRSIQYAKASSFQPNCHFIIGNIDTISFTHAFDVIICTDVLEHISDTREFIANLHHWLKDDGRLFLAVPNGWGPFEIMSHIRDFFIRIVRTLKIKNLFYTIFRRMMRDISEVQSYNLESPHVQVFTKSKVVRLLINAKLKPVRLVNLSFILIAVLLNSPLGIIISPESKCFRWLEIIDSILVDFVPPWMAGSWLFVVQKSSMNKNEK